MQPESTAASSPQSDTLVDELEASKEIAEETTQNGEADATASVEEMDQNSRQLMTLLQTSQVSTSI